MQFYEGVSIKTSWSIGNHYDMFRLQIMFIITELFGENMEFVDVVILKSRNKCERKSSFEWIDLEIILYHL